ncbi:hypothetical protein CMUS01_11171 [Colletotrichum musicola]|uniref:Uncharacterized protein n=1 Tax=Colletotrichum musicola TaxID=2175873 RepID=A0A8H6K0V3_9PEZI|nr:hypothetical protein CMUS01_11171 [Colletotrichum musicola]
MDLRSKRPQPGSEQPSQQHGQAVRASLPIGSVARHMTAIDRHGPWCIRCVNHLFGLHISEANRITDAGFKCTTQSGSSTRCGKCITKGVTAAKCKKAGPSPNLPKPEANPPSTIRSPIGNGRPQSCRWWPRKWPAFLELEAEDPEAASQIPQKDIDDLLCQYRAAMGDSRQKALRRRSRPRGPTAAPGREASPGVAHDPRARHSPPTAGPGGAPQSRAAAPGPACSPAPDDRQRAGPALPGDRPRWYKTAEETVFGAVADILKDPPPPRVTEDIRSLLSNIVGRSEGHANRLRGAASVVPTPIRPILMAPWIPSTAFLIADDLTRSAPDSYAQCERLIPLVRAELCRLDSTLHIMVEDLPQRT